MFLFSRNSSKEYFHASIVFNWRFVEAMRFKFWTLFIVYTLANSKDRYKMTSKKISRTMRSSRFCKKVLTLTWDRSKNSVLMLFKTNLTNRYGMENTIYWTAMSKHLNSWCSIITREGGKSLLSGLVRSICSKWSLNIASTIITVRKQRTNLSSSLGRCP